MNKKRIFENLIADSGNGMAAVLPPLWQVIYQEACRANHLLFAKADVLKFERDQSKFPIGQADALAKTMVELFSCNDLSSLQSYICDLPYRKRRHVYLVYLRFLESWRFQMRQSLN